MPSQLPPPNPHPSQLQLLYSKHSKPRSPLSKTKKPSSAITPTTKIPPPSPTRRTTARRKALPLRRRRQLRARLPGAGRAARRQRQLQPRLHMHRDMGRRVRARIQSPLQLGVVSKPLRLRKVRRHRVSVNGRLLKLPCRSPLLRQSRTRAYPQPPRAQVLLVLETWPAVGSVLCLVSRPASSKLR